MSWHSLNHAQEAKFSTNIESRFVFVGGTGIADFTTVVRPYLFEKLLIYSATNWVGRNFFWAHFGLTDDVVYVRIPDTDMF